MTPAEQIAHLRLDLSYYDEDIREAVCDLAERALADEQRWRLTADVIGFAERLADNVAGNPAEYGLHIYAIPGAQDLLMAVRRLREALPEERVEHRLVSSCLPGSPHGCTVQCSCMAIYSGGSPDAAVHAWAAHAGIGGTE